MKIVLHFLIGLILVLISGCSNDNNSAKNETLFYWNQTKCGDPWKTGENDSNKDTEVALETFLKNENVAVEMLRFETIPELATDCESCGCTTGLKIIVNVGEPDISKMKELGFYQ